MIGLLAQAAHVATSSLPSTETVQMVALPANLLYGLAAAMIIGPAGAIVWVMRRQNRALDRVMADDRSARELARADERESRLQRDAFIREQMIELRQVSANNATTTGVLQVLAARLGAVESTLGAAASGSMAQHAATQTLVEELRTDIAEVLGKPLPRRAGRVTAPTILGMAALAGAGVVAVESAQQDRHADARSHVEHAELYTPAIRALERAYPDPIQ